MVRRTLLCLTLLATACQSQKSGQVEAGEDRHATCLVVVRLMQLEDSDRIGSIGSVAETAERGLLVTDRFASRVLSYDVRGRLLARAGARGGGPGEFMTIGGVVALSDGGALVIDPELARATFLGPSLAIDSTRMVFPPPTGEVDAVGSRYVMTVRSQRRQIGLATWTNAWEREALVEAPTPAHAIGVPYWEGFATRKLVVAGPTIAVSYSLGYPIFLLNRDLETVGTLEMSPAGYRPPPVLEPGAFVGAGSRARVDAWMNSFDAIANLTTVADSLLIVIHGKMSINHATGRAETTHERMDVYHVVEQAKVAEGIPLPTGARVLGGGSDGVYMLVSGPPYPWTIAVGRLATGLRALPRDDGIMPGDPWAAGVRSGAVACADR